MRHQCEINAALMQVMHTCLKICVTILLEGVWCARFVIFFSFSGDTQLPILTSCFMQGTVSLEQGSKFDKHFSIALQVFCKIILCGWKWFSAQLWVNHSCTKTLTYTGLIFNNLQTQISFGFDKQLPSPTANIVNLTKPFCKSNESGNEPIMKSWIKKWSIMCTEWMLLWRVLQTSPYLMRLQAWSSVMITIITADFDTAFRCYRFILNSHHSSHEFKIQRQIIAKGGMYLRGQ